MDESSYLLIEMIFVDLNPASLALVGERRLENAPEGLRTDFASGRSSIGYLQQLVSLVRNERLRPQPVLQDTKRGETSIRDN